LGQILVLQEVFIQFAGHFGNFGKFGGRGSAEIALVIAGDRGH